METEPRATAAAPSTRPDDEALHARLVAGDPTASADLAATHLAGLVGALRARFPNVDRSLLETAAIDLLLDLAETPARYDPARGGLRAYLTMATGGDVLNALRAERRRARHLVPVENVELLQRAGNLLVSGPEDPADIVSRQEPLDPRLVVQLRGSFDDREWEVVQLMLEGERRTAIYADLLGLPLQSEVDRARDVKRVKDRLRKRLQRLAARVKLDG